MHAGKPLKRAGARLKPFDGRADAARSVEQGEELRIGPAAAKHFEALFAAAHAGEPVVDQDHARIVHARKFSRKRILGKDRFGPLAA